MQWVTVADAATALSISARTVVRLIERHDLDTRQRADSTHAILVRLEHVAFAATRRR